MSEEKKERQREEREEKLSPSGAPSLADGGTARSPILRKLDNFWYHYKWPFLFGVLALIVLTVSLVQCVGNGRGDDAHVMYAGGYILTGTESRDFENSIVRFVEDRNGDGRQVLALGFYAIFTDAEIETKPLPDRPHYKQYSYDNRQNFDQEILLGEATVCFLSQSLFEEVARAGGLRPIEEGTPLPVGAELVMYGNTAYGIRLRSLAISTYPGLSRLPEDTVLTTRAMTSLGQLLGGKREAEELYRANIALYERILAAAPYVPAQ